jgi:GNAT superfamily N-acetyltransferase
MEQFLDVYQEGWNIPHDLREGSRINLRGWLGRPDWRLYLARVDGRAAAAAKLFMHDGVAFFCDGTTHPDFRGRGLQTALLRHRAAVARERGAELLFSHAEFGSSSHRNMERLGLRVLHTRAIWTRPPESKTA